MCQWFFIGTFFSSAHWHIPFRTFRWMSDNHKRIPIPEIFFVSVENARRFFVIAIPAFWIIALFLPAYSAQHEKTFGFECLAYGWMAAKEVPLAFVAWNGNFLWLAAYLILVGSQHRASMVGAILLSFVAFVMSLGAISMTFYAGNKYHLSFGYFLWQLSFVLLVVACVWKSILITKDHH